ncbi:uncharacterized protein LOC131852733 [Achroia grisella]|uniref:uncharacterized protein LOC131852733 n=1 Tax=Achroia grisella TaxID=688607 RepID=UPI0027D2075C|nr:uncharacterized protein LOC131852733 [Achroia grisella]
MNTEKTSVRKKCELPKSANIVSTEIFVLPPNLLEKLGIHLENVTKESPTEVPFKTDIVHPNDLSNNKDTELPSNVNSKSYKNINNPKETSILETAKLMKKSVFLSPSFQPTITNSIPGEMEIAKISNQPEINGNDVVMKKYINNLDDKITDIIINKNASEELRPKSFEVHSKINQQIDIQNFVSDKSMPKLLQNGTERSEIQNCHLNNTENSLQSVRENISIDNHPSVLDDNNTNMSTLNISQSRKSTHNKVNIISQEIVVPSQFKEIKSLNCRNANSLIPIPINSVISIKNNCKNYDKLPLDLPNYKERMSNALNKNVDLLGIEYDNDDKDFMSEEKEIGVNSQLKDVKLLNTSNSNSLNLEIAPDFTGSNIDLEKIDIPIHEQCINYVFTGNVEIEYINDCCANLTSEEKDTVVTTLNESPKVLYKNKDIVNNIDTVKYNYIDAVPLSDDIYINEMEKPINVNISNTDYQMNDESVYDNKLNICKEETVIANLTSELNLSNEMVVVQKCSKKLISNINRYNKSPSSLIGNHANICTGNSSVLSIDSDSENMLINTNTNTKDKISIKIYNNIDGDKNFSCNKCTEINHMCLNSKTCESQCTEKNIADVNTMVVVNSPMDKVEEIANYLSQYSQLIEKKKLLIQNQRHNDVENILSTNVKSDLTMSKLCIQGVEKPGGQYQKFKSLQSKNLKSYKKKVSRKEIHRETLPHYKNIFKEIIADNIDCDDNFKETSVSNLLTQQFCLCCDFGRLVCYDLYEHIHFWKHPNMNYNIDTVISIYSDDCKFVDRDLILENLKDESSEFVQDICWNVMNRFEEALMPSYDQNSRIGSNVSLIGSDLDLALCINSGKVPEKSCGVNVTKTDVRVVDKSGEDEREIYVLEKSEISKHSENSESPMYKGTDTNNICSDFVTTTKIISSALVQEKSSRRTEVKLESKDEELCTNKQRKIYENPNKKIHVKPIDNCGTGASVELKDKQKGRKRHINSDVSDVMPHKYVKCVVCELMVAEIDWESYMSEEHCFIAWKAGDNVNWENLELTKNLKDRLKNDGCLKCCRCDTKIEQIDSFLSHIKNCLNLKESKFDVQSNINKKGMITTKEVGVKYMTGENSDADTSETKPKKRGRKKRNISDVLNLPNKNYVKCAVCEQMILETDWKNHANEKHCFIAWKAGDTFNWADLELLNKLKQILKSKGYLKCNYCGAQIKKSNKFLTHVKNCLHLKESTIDEQNKMSEDRMNSNNLEEHNSADTSMELTKNKRRGRKRKISNNSIQKPVKMVKCAVCKQMVNEVEWDTHITEGHNCVAWKDGDKFDYDDPDLLKKLREKLKDNGFLICTFCDTEMKQAKRFLTHVQQCAELKASNSPKINFRSVNIKIEPEKSKPTAVTTCGVCMQDIADHLWVEHISTQHHYLAWKYGDKPLDLNDEDALKRHLVDMVQQHGGIMCINCGLLRKYTIKTIKYFLAHIKTCGVNNSVNQTNEPNDTNIVEIHISPPEASVKVNDTVVSCAVCQESMNSTEWIEHLSKKHSYLAWKVGEEAPDFKDHTSKYQYLYDIAKKENGLICSKCGLVRKYVKPYLHHIKVCSGDTGQTHEDSSPNNTSTCSVNVNNLSDLGVIGSAQCGVCNNTIDEEKWIPHIQQEHGYFARVSGQPPLDTNDPDMLHEHLYTILKISGSLICNICGLERKYVKKYMEHVQTCNKKNCLNEEGMYVCGVCHENVQPQDWKNHSMKKHYNVAWIVGDKPIDLTSTYGAEKNIKEYKEKFGKLVCKTCGVSRSSYMGFYAHIITCGKTEEEMEMYKIMCDICNSKYLCIYKSQHMGMHREKEYAMERKRRALEAQENNKEDFISGPRKAAVKAKTVIDNYRAVSEFKYKCSDCLFGTDIETELSNHKCKKNDLKLNEPESEKSDESEDESGDSVDSDISNEEERALVKRRKRKRGAESNASSKVPRIPFVIKDIRNYLEKSFNDYTKFILTSEKLFPQFQNCEFVAISKEKESQYLPLLKESCKVKFSKDEWTTYNRFEAKSTGDIKSIFVGGSIRCLSWLPPHTDVNMDKCRQFIAVACHREADCPRSQPDQLTTQKSLIQIWDLGHLSCRDVPNFALGIALDYGIVWAMDWCPSGTRDTVADPNVKPDRFLRIGLLAVACSNGLAYIFSVPYPSYITNSEQKIFKLKPIAELRLVMNSDRKKYQTSSICWSKQKGHSTVIVGYADGCTAYFDLNTESPLLRTVENGVTILYPFYDERSLNSCITDISTYPNGDRESTTGAAAVVGPTGAALVTRATVAPPHQQMHLAYSSVEFTPGWPTAMISGDEAVMNQSANELEVWGCGRRLGLMQVCSGCQRCGCVVAFMPPYLRSMRIHPARGELNKKPLAMLRMTELSGRKRKHVKDELAMKLEPISYEGAIKKYGIELTLVNKKNKNEFYQSMQTAKDVLPERFPLSDVVSISFCPTGDYHRTLAVGTHAGLIFFLDVV